MSLKKFLHIVESEERFVKALAHHENLSPHPARNGDMPALAPELLQGLKSLEIDALYSHQSQAIDQLLDGKNVVAVTPTASGKSLLYNLPVIQTIIQSSDARALYVFPLKALEQDQRAKLMTLLCACGLDDRLSVGIYDGDTPGEERAGMRRSPPRVLITNPDMLHLSLMSYHAQWEELFRGLRFVVVDELHVYRGVFGSHILHVLRRLIRLCRFYGTTPQFVAASATIAGAKELAETLTGLPFEMVERSGAPVSRRHFLMFKPQDSYLTFALWLFTTALSCGLKSIMFTKSRRTTELLHRWLGETNGEIARRVSSYRAGFLPEERREIERSLLTGKLDGVISTSALELGIDIGGLDVCILVGYPGTVAATWQRAGRVGRGRMPSAICLVAGTDQLDQYFIRNPGDFFSRSVEMAVVDASNENIAKPHLLCCAQELPISTTDPLATDPLNRRLIESLVSEGKLLLGASGDRWFSARSRPQREVDVRSTGDRFSIETADTKRALGSVSGRAAYAECHQGAIYLHRGEQYIVDDLDLKAKTARVTPYEANHYTVPLFEKETEILEEFESCQLGLGSVKRVKLMVTEQLMGYQKRRQYTQELLSQHNLEFEPTSFETIGLALAVPQEIAAIALDEELHFRGGIHGVEHAMLALAPLFALCDRNDMGGYSQATHPQIGGPAIFLYDGYPGGIGLSNRLYKVFLELAGRTLKLIKSCSCESGCPSCIHSPKCGHGNVPLDKAAAILTLEVITGALIPKPSARPSLRQRTESQSSMNVAPSTDKAVGTRATMVSVPKSWNKDRTAVVFDLETQRSAAEVGGWGNIRAMGLAWAVIQRFPSGQWQEFGEPEVGALIEALQSADLVIGFNLSRFDYEVLRGYSGFDFRQLPTYDILAHIHRALGHRLSLNAVASATLGVTKSADGLQSIEWWKQGKVEKVAEYCRKDVEVTRDLFFYLLENGYLLFEKRGVGLVRIPMKRDF